MPKTDLVTTLEDFPRVSPALVEALEKRFPDRLPTALVTDPSVINARIGEQRVIQFLKSQASSRAPV